MRLLLNADLTKRIGCLKNGPADIRKHKWFRGMDWSSLRQKKIPPPILPEVSHPADTGAPRIPFWARGVCWCVVIRTKRGVFSRLIFMLSKQVSSDPVSFALILIRRQFRRMYVSPPLWTPLSPFEPRPV